MRYGVHLPVGVFILSALSPALINADVNGVPPSRTVDSTDPLPDNDVEIRGNSARQTGLVDTGFLPQRSIAGSGQQLPPEKIRAGEVRQGEGARVPSGHGGPMVPKKETQSVMDNVSVQLAFTPNSVRVLAARAASGTLPAEQYVNGEYLYVIYENNEVLYAGTFNDPLLEHALARAPEEVHQRRLSEGSMTIRVPSSVLVSGKSAAYLHVFALGPGVQQTEILNKVSAQDIAGRSTALGDAIPVARIRAKLASDG